MSKQIQAILEARTFRLEAIKERIERSTLDTDVMRAIAQILELWGVNEGSYIDWAQGKCDGYLTAIETILNHCNKNPGEPPQYNP